MPRRQRRRSGLRRERSRDVVRFLANPRAPLPRIANIDEAVGQIEALQARSGGATFNLYFGNLLGKRLYAVALYPDPGRAAIVQGRIIPRALLRGFIRGNLDLLRDPQNSIGTWYNEDDGNTYIEVSVTLASRVQAVELGRQYNQIAIFDLSSLNLIPLGGSGDPGLDIPPEVRRLPRFRRGRKRGRHNPAEASQ